MKIRAKTVEADGWLEMTFRRDGRLVTKRGHILADRDHMRHAMLIAAREADRDIAFEMAGDNWREATEFPFKGFWRFDERAFTEIFGEWPLK